MDLAADAPNAADWLAAWGQVGGAVATTAAVVVALWLAVRDRKWRRSDHTAAEERRRAADAAAASEREERAASPARLVTSDCEVHFVTVDGGDAETDFRVAARAADFGPVCVKHVVWVTIYNGSQAPIFVPRVEDVSSPIDNVVAIYHLFRPETASEDGSQVVLNAGESMRIPLVCEGDDGKLIDAWMGADALIRFSDSERRKWRRGGIALPTLLPDQASP